VREAATVTPGSLLISANRLLTGTGLDTHARWPIACALLIRLALEQALDSFWARCEPTAAACSMRAQLLILPQYAPNEVAAAVREAWAGLAHAVHHHPYELAPTGAELRDWHQLVCRIVNDLTSSKVRPSSRSTNELPT
jgi:hypothetical protein